MSRVLLVSPSYNYPAKHEMYPSGALLLLGTMAREHGHEVKVVHMVTDRLSVNDVAQLARNMGVVGVAISTFQVATAKRLLKALKTQTTSRIVIGGSHPTGIGLEQAKVEFPEADDIICGEGEHRFMSILDGCSVDKPKDLEYVPPPDLSLVDISRFSGAYPLGKTPTTFSFFSRGCPNFCSFCDRSIFGNKVRYRSPKNALRELRYFAAYGIKEAFIQDDTFNLNRSWYEEILQGIIAEGLNKKMRFRAPFRANEKLVDEKILRLAKEAGFWLIFYGVESGNQGMLDRMHKKLSLGEIERAVRLTKEVGIKVETSFIVGLPGETQETVRDTAMFYRKLAPFWSGCGIAIPFPSTDLYREIKPQLNGMSFEDYRPGMVYYRTDELDKQQIQDTHTRIDRQMMIDKMVHMIGHPDMLLRTVKDKVR